MKNKYKQKYDWRIVHNGPSENDISKALDESIRNYIIENQNKDSNIKNPLDGIFSIIAFSAVVIDFILLIVMIWHREIWMLKLFITNIVVYVLMIFLYRVKESRISQMRGYRVKRSSKSYKVQVRFLFLWRTLAIYPYSRFPTSEAKAENEAIAIISELIKRSS